MKKLITLIAVAALGISTIGCAEKKPAAPAAPPPGAEAPKVEGGTPEPAPATTEEKK
jgi:hypothetical protein